MKITKLLALVVAALSFFCSTALAQPSSGASNVNGRECLLRFTPSIGYLSRDGGNSDPILRRIGINKKELEAFDYINVNLELDALVPELLPNLFATASLMYSHDFYNAPVGGGIDIFGLPLGARYVLFEGGLRGPAATQNDDVRYWVGATVGPYIMSESITVDIGGRNTQGSNTNAAVGVAAQTGVDYFFHKNIGAGVQAKFQYIFFNHDIMIFSGGPSLIGKF